MDDFLRFLFWIHDQASMLLARYLFVWKRLILIVAHLSLFGLLFPYMRKDFGEMAEILLFALLFLSPVSKILRMRLLLQAMSLRREFGIFMAYLATVHAIGFFIDPAWLELLLGPYREGGIFMVDPGLLFGTAAYLLTLPLLLTSNALAQRLLGGRWWKHLHRLVYAVFVAVVLHRMLIRGGADAGGVFQAIVLISAYILAKLLARKNFIAPLRDIIDIVARRYQEYKAAEKGVPVVS